MKDWHHVLRIRDLGLLFGGLGVLESLNVDIQTGSRTAIIGPNGAGKTTLFNVLCGVYTPTYGEILLDGRDIVDVPLHRRAQLGIARTFQNLRLMKHLTVLENVMLGQHHRTSLARMTLVPLLSRLNSSALDEARQALDAVDLLDEADRLAEGLSYGMQKRVELARALVSKPKVLLLDEPAAGLNTAEREELLASLLAAVGPDVTLLLIEHDLKFVERLCNHIVVLNFGRKIAEGTLAEVCKSQAVYDAYLGPPTNSKAVDSAAA